MYQGWVWPVERHPLDGRLPVVSDGFSRTGRGGNGHYGVDIMYRRSSPGTPRLPEVTKAFEMPSDSVRVLAAGPGTVLAVHLADPHGISLELDHHNSAGAPRCTAYRHMSLCIVKAGQVVVAGQQLGIVGYDKTAARTATPNHLHFELWDTALPQTGDQSQRRKRFGIDPVPFMRLWTVKGRGGASGNDTLPPGGGIGTGSGLYVEGRYEAEEGDDPEAAAIIGGLGMVFPFL